MKLIFLITGLSIFIMTGIAMSEDVDCEQYPEYCADKGDSGVEGETDDETTDEGEMDEENN